MTGLAGWVLGVDPHAHTPGWEHAAGFVGLVVFAFLVRPRRRH